MGTDIQPVSQDMVLSRLAKGGLTLADLLTAVIPAEKEVNPPPVRLPSKPVITQDAADAVGRLIEVISNGVVPTERRKLEDDEVVSLLAERALLDRVSKLIDARKEAQKIAVQNHHDCMIEASMTPEEVANLERDSNGHYLVPGFVRTGAFEHGFRRRIQQAAPTLEAGAMEALIGEVPGFTREMFLECTTAVRVPDEAKIMLTMRQHPAVIVEVLKQASTPGKKTIFHELAKEPQ